MPGRAVSRSGAIAVAVAAVLGLALLYYLRTLVLPFMLALFLAYLVSPLVDQLERAGVGRAAASGIVLASLLAGVVAGGVLLLPALGREVGRVVAQVPSGTSPVGWLTGWTTGMMPGPWRGLAGQLNAGMERWMREFTSRVVASGGELASMAYALLFVPFIAYYFLLDRGRLGLGVLRRLPPPWRPHVAVLGAEIGTTLAGFVRGQVLVSALVGVATALAMAALRVPFPLLVGVLAGLLDVIPYFGPVIAAVPAVVAGFSVSSWTPVFVVLTFFAIHQLESVFLVPRVMGSLTGLHPLAVLAAILAGEQVLGLTGMLLAVPAAACLRILVDHWTLRRGTGGEPGAVAGADGTRQAGKASSGRVDKLGSHGYDGEDSVQGRGRGDTPAAVRETRCDD